MLPHLLAVLAQCVVELRLLRHALSLDVARVPRQRVLKDFVSFNRGLLVLRERFKIA